MVCNYALSPSSPEVMKLVLPAVQLNQSETTKTLLVQTDTFRLHNAVTLIIIIAFVNVYNAVLTFMTKFLPDFGTRQFVSQGSLVLTVINTYIRCKIITFHIRFKY